MPNLRYKVFNVNQTTCSAKSLLKNVKENTEIPVPSFPKTLQFSRLPPTTRVDEKVTAENTENKCRTSTYETCEINNADKEEKLGLCSVSEQKISSESTKDITMRSLAHLLILF